MTHYVCTGDCEGESGAAGICQDEGCTKEGEPLLECNCEDGAHEGTGKKEGSEETE